MWRSTGSTMSILPEPTDLLAHRVTEQKFEDYVKAGGRLLLHHDGIGFYLKGGDHATGQGLLISHPGIVNIEVSPTGRMPELTEGITPFTVADEEYQVEMDESQTQVTWRAARRSTGVPSGLGPRVRKGQSGRTHTWPQRHGPGHPWCSAAFRTLSAGWCMIASACSSENCRSELNQDAPRSGPHRQLAASASDPTTVSSRATNPRMRGQPARRRTVYGCIKSLYDGPPSPSVAGANDAARMILQFTFRGFDRNATIAIAADFDGLGGHRTEKVCNVGNTLPPFDTTPSRAGCKYQPCPS